MIQKELLVILLVGKSFGPPALLNAVAFNYYGIINNKSNGTQLFMGDKSLTSSANVHIGHWLVKTAACTVWLEGINDILASCLVDELKGDTVSERPLEDVIMFSTHNHKEQREESAITIAHDVELQAHLIAIPPRIEWGRIH